MSNKGAPGAAVLVSPEAFSEWQVLPASPEKFQLRQLMLGETLSICDHEGGEFDFVDVGSWRSPDVGNWQNSPCVEGEIDLYYPSSNPVLNGPLVATRAGWCVALLEPQGRSASDWISDIPNGLVTFRSTTAISIFYCQQEGSWQ